MTKLKNKLWKVFSEFIRLRDSDRNGYCKCVSCGVVKNWKEMDAGHYIAKNKGNCHYFDENNVHAQCRSCNCFKHGNLLEYRRNLINKIGEKRVELLDKYTLVKYSDNDYELLIKHYKEKVKELKNID